jgi:hypothetical protein
LEVIADVTETDFSNMGVILSGLNDAIQFWIGDWANLYHDAWGHKYDAIASNFGLDPDTVSNYAWVCRKIHSSWRKDNLKFTHHLLVAGLPEYLQGREVELLEIASKRRMSTRQFQAFIAELKQHQLPAADSGWLFSKEQRPRVSAKMQRLWTKARHGDVKARRELMVMVDEHRRWLDRLVESIDG